MTTLFTSGTSVTPEASSFPREEIMMDEKNEIQDNLWHRPHDKASIEQVRFDNLTPNAQRFVNMTDDARIPLQISLTQQIHLLREEMNTLRVNSGSFRDKMECILSTLENLNEVSLSKKSPWISQGAVEQYGCEEITKTPISFKSPDGRKWVTGIASRISRDDVGPKSVDSNPSSREVHIKSLTEVQSCSTQMPVFAPNVQNDRLPVNLGDKISGMNAEIQIKNCTNNNNARNVAQHTHKLHLKSAEARPNSDFFIITRPEDTIGRETTISQTTAGNLLNNEGDEKFSNPSPKSATGEEQVRMVPVLDRTSKTLLTSEDSIDSGYHGGIANHQGDQNEIMDIRLSALRETNDKEDLVPVVTSGIGNADNKNEIARPSTLALTSISDIRTDNPTQMKDNAQSVEDVSEQGKPKVLPRSTKRIKMGVSAVMGPKPKSRTVFSSAEDEELPGRKDICESTSDKGNRQILKYIQSGERTEVKSQSTEQDFRKKEPKRTHKTKKQTIFCRDRPDVGGRTSESETESASSALRRRSMRMMAEFKLFDFSDSVKGIHSNLKTSPKKAGPAKPTNEAKNNEKPCCSEKKSSVETATIQVQANQSQPPRRVNSNGKNKKKSEFKYTKESLPPPPLPPPPSPPREVQHPVHKEAPLVGFTSIAAHTREAMICHAGTGTPLSSPRCVRRPVYGSTRSLQSTGTVNLIGSIPSNNPRVTNFTPSEGSAFTPVGYASKSVIDVPTSCHNRSQGHHYESGKRKNENDPQPFKRRSSLPPSAISNRSQYKKTAPDKRHLHKDEVKSESSTNIHTSVKNENIVAKDANFKRSVSMRLPKSRLPCAERKDLENYPVAFDRDDNIKSVVGKLKQEGYLSGNKKSSTKASKEASTKKKPNSSTRTSLPSSYTSDKKSKVIANKPEVIQYQSPRTGRRTERADPASCQKLTSSSAVGRYVSYAEHPPVKEPSNKGLISMGMIRSSFRSKRGKSAPSATSAMHEFCGGYSKENIQATRGAKADVPEQKTSENSRNKVKQRVDLKPATPTPAVAKARRKKLAGEKSGKSSMVGMLIDKLQLSKSDSSAHAHSRATKDDSHVISKGKRREQTDVITASVPTTRRFFKFPTRDDNLKCGSLTSTSSVSSMTSHAPNSPLKGRSTYV